MEIFDKILSQRIFFYPPCCYYSVEVNYAIRVKRKGVEAGSKMRMARNSGAEKADFIF
jgi:hypothetical protein